MENTKCKSVCDSLTSAEHDELVADSVDFAYSNGIVIKETRKFSQNQVIFSRLKLHSMPKVNSAEIGLTIFLHLAIMVEGARI